MTDRNNEAGGPSRLCRRKFLRVGAGVAAASALLNPVDVLAHYGNMANAALEPVRQLSMINLNTRERLSVDYWAQGRYVVDALRRINHLLRDHHDGSIHWIDPRLVDVMYGVFRMTGGCGPIEVVCGYRSPRTNARMHARHRGVAGHSMHIQGKAVDIRMPGCGLEMLHRAALALRAGGVGFYPASNFGHVDPGPVRTWGGHSGEDEWGDTPAWRDALLSDTPKVEQAADAGLLPAEPDRGAIAEAVMPRSRFGRGGDFATNAHLPSHKPMRVAMRETSSPVQSEGFWVRRKPRPGTGG